MTKFKVGEEVKICNVLKAKIESIEKENNELQYCFRDEKGEKWYELEENIEKC